MPCFCCHNNTLLVFKGKDINSPPKKKKLFQAVEVAELEAAVGVSQMHSAAFAVAEELAFSTFVFLHPGPVAINLESVVPHVHEIILVDIALVVVRPDAHAGGDGTVVEH